MSRKKQTPKNDLWRYRKRAGLSQKRVAYLLGLKSAAQISLWEDGKKLPSLRNLLKLAYALNAPIEFLFSALAKEYQEEVIERRESIGPINE